MSESNDLTISQKYRRAIKSFIEVTENNNGRSDAIQFQSKVCNLIKQFTMIKSIAEDLKLFSSNETIDEVNTNYLTFFNVNYYLAKLYSISMLNINEESSSPSIGNKAINLQTAKTLYVQYLFLLEDYKLLLPLQSKIINSFKDSYNPSLEELTVHDPVNRRQEKIENYKLSKQLEGKLQVLHDFYNEKDDVVEDNGANSFLNFEELIVKQVYLDQIQFFVLQTFSALESLSMELQVLSKMPKELPQIDADAHQQKDSRVLSRENDYGYTTKLEANPQKSVQISDILSKQGKILRPFTITSNKQQLKQKVFGTGQVLPSMSVEEYLDYELKNGKMAAEDNSRKKESDDEDYNSDDELEKRLWDDWKDDNPKGSGNIGGNIG